MGIYDLDNSTYFKHDIEDTIAKIDAFYAIKNEEGKPFFLSKKIVPKSVLWFSDEAQDAFNQLIPSVKSLTKDMYAIIETLVKSIEGKFDVRELEKRYSGFAELRLLNNKFKHLNNKEAEITLTSLVIMEPTFGNLIDVSINFKYPERLICPRFCDLILTYFRILEAQNVLKWEL